jgi:hypothetical protein
MIFVSTTNSIQFRPNKSELAQIEMHQRSSHKYRIEIQPFVSCVGLQIEVINDFLIPTHHLTENKLKRNNNVECYFRMEDRASLRYIQL